MGSSRSRHLLAGAEGALLLPSVACRRPRSWMRWLQLPSQNLLWRCQPLFFPVLSVTVANLASSHIQRDYFLRRILRVLIEAMGSPLSVGDVIALSKLAITLGRAFTKGRRSAPEEFREVESQLYSLSAALDSITSLITELPAGTDASDSLSHAIQSCRRTLTHLESVVTKYGVLKKDSEPIAGGSRFRRWNEILKTGWKSIVWTTEGGDLAALRINLTVHMNSLDLLLGVMVKYVNPDSRKTVSQMLKPLTAQKQGSSGLESTRFTTFCRMFNHGCQKTSPLVHPDLEHKHGRLHLRATMLVNIPRAQAFSCTSLQKRRCWSAVSLHWPLTTMTIIGGDPKPGFSHATVPRVRTRHG
jgi:hypothetical protein